jgi:hypothetical protein
MEYCFSFWNLPEEITSAILCHHEGIEKKTGLARILVLSHFIVKMDSIDESELDFLYNITELTRQELILLNNGVKKEMEMVNFFFE